MVEVVQNTSLLYEPVQFLYININVSNGSRRTFLKLPVYQRNFSSWDHLEQHRNTACIRTLRNKIERPGLERELGGRSEGRISENTALN
jgi:hypothetical protein